MGQAKVRFYQYLHPRLDDAASRVKKLKISLDMPVYGLSVVILTFCNINTRLFHFILHL
jgi:hypothetical protein